MFLVVAILGLAFYVLLLSLGRAAARGDRMARRPDHLEPAVASAPPLLRRRPIGSRRSLEIAIEAPDNVALAEALLEKVR